MLQLASLETPWPAVTCEKRGKKRYCYLKIRSVYLGRSPQVKRALRRARAARQPERRRCRAAEVEAEQLNRSLAELEAVMAALMQATMLVAGYHAHRGQWRKKHNGRADPQPQTGHKSGRPGQENE